MRENGAFRAKKTSFTQVSNEVILDKVLSLKAKGLYTLIQHFITIPNFTLYKNTLKKSCIEGEKAFESTWKELKDSGYLKQYRLKGKDGTFYYEYDLLDYIHTPKKEVVEKDVAEKVGSEKVDSGKRGKYNKTNPNKTNPNNTNTNNTPKGGGKKKTFTNDSTSYMETNSENIDRLEALSQKFCGSADI